MVLATGGSAAFASSASATDYVSPVDPTVRYSVPDVWEPGEDLVVSGTGWRVLDGSKGSVIGVFVDATRSGDPNTVHTRREVIDPVTAEASTDSRLHAIVEADTDGTWTATIPYPTAENARLADGSWKDWEPGSGHQLRFLSGTLETRTADVARSLAAEVTVAGAPAENGPPPWSHDTVVFTDPDSGEIATAWVENAVGAGDSATVRIRGEGWTTRDGSSASTIAVKLNRGDGQQYTRSGSDVVAHPSATGDDTIWTLLAPSNPNGHPNVIPIGADGDFDVEIELPSGLIAGQYLTVLFQSGRFDAGDVLRTATTDFLTVGGVPYDGSGTDDEVTCRTDRQPSVRIVEPSVSLGGSLRLLGEGWCHPGENRGGSAIAIKIDEGGVSRLTPEIHQNTTIWATIVAEAADGSFDVEIALPDGTSAGAQGSIPAFAEGGHTLRLLSGSLKSGDALRSLRTDQFVVGQYRPHGAPEPKDAATLLATNGNGVTVERRASSLVVTVPKARAGTWVFVTPYAADGSPRYPWLDRWSQTDASGRVALPLDGRSLPNGRLKVAVQSGERDSVGALLGWGWLAAQTSTPEPKPQTPVVVDPDAGGDVRSDALASERPSYSLAARTPARRAPTTVPPAPFANVEGLTAANAGVVSATLDGTIVTLHLAHHQQGDWVYIYAYSTPVPVGWIQVDEHRNIRIDAAALRDGEHRFVALDEAGELIGWAGIRLGSDATSGAEPARADGADAAVDLPDDPELDSARSHAGGLSSQDAWMLAGGAGVAAVILVLALIVMPSRRARVAATADAERGER